MLKNKLIKLQLIFFAIFNNAYIQAMNVPTKDKPVGLNNEGNTCFMNSLLQALYNIDEMTSFLMAKDRTGYYKKDSVAQEYINFLKIYKEAQKKDEKSFAPVKWCTKMWGITDEKGNKIFPERATGDAAELLLILLDRLFDSDVADPANEPHYGFPRNKSLKTELSELFHLIIGDITYNKTTKEIWALKGSLFSILPLNLIDWGNSAGKLYDNIIACLDDYFAYHKIEEGALETKRSIIQLPKRLIIKYARWYEDKNKKYRKIYQGVKFPVNGLNLNEYLNHDIIQHQQPVYDLTAIIMHYGEGAHYSAYIKKGAQWYYCNDSSVTPKTVKDVADIANSQKEHMDPTPYILFYEQRPQVSVKYPSKFNGDKNKLWVALMEHFDKVSINNYLKNNKITPQDLVNGIDDHFITVANIIEYIYDYIIQKQEHENNIQDLITMTNGLIGLSNRS